MSIIEQAARRLEELRRSGIELPPGNTPAGSAVAGMADSTVESLPARAARRIESERPVANRVPPRPGARQDAAPATIAPETRSRQVQIDLRRLAATGHISPDQAHSRIADEFRIIKRQLLVGAAEVRRQNLIMITSTLPGEGKTFVALNLAISIAMERDKTVLLVDADVSRPAVLERLGLQQSPGLLDVLAGTQPSINDAMLRTNIDKLALLPAGTPRAQATELLASDAMTQLLDDMSSRYADRIVVFDAPPLLPSTESRVLAARMGQVVLVVEADRTPHRSVMQALAAIEACPVVLPLLNKASRSEVGAYYGQYGPGEN